MNGEFETVNQYLFHCYTDRYIHLSINISIVLHLF